jgi:hypothetical protein
VNCGALRLSLEGQRNKIFNAMNRQDCMASCKTITRYLSIVNSVGNKNNQNGEKNKQNHQTEK